MIKKIDLTKSKINFNQKIIREIEKLKGAEVQIGILGATNRGNSKGKSNAQIAQTHEEGLKGLPRRSFLADSIEYSNFSKELKKKTESGRFGSTEKLLLKESGIVEWLDQVGALASSYVKNAFQIGGYRPWQPNKNPERKKTNKILIETAQLLRSITFKTKIKS